MESVLDFEFIDAHLPKGKLGPLQYAKLPRSVKDTIARRGTVNFTWYVQRTGYWCGPTTAQMLLKARGVDVSQQTLANEMGTDEDGTDYIGLMLNPLNKRLKAGYYAKYGPTKEQLWAYFNDSINSGYGVACNIVTTPGVYNPPGYPNYRVWHYVPGFGTRGSATKSGDTRQIFCGDSANFSGVKEWWVSLNMMTGLVSQKGIAPTPAASFLGLDALSLASVATNFRQLGPT